MTLTLAVDGVAYNNAKSISVKRDLRNYVGRFRASLAMDVVGLSQVRRGSSVQITNSLGGTIFNGYAEVISVSNSPTSREIRVSGRDVTADLVDSTLVKKQFTGPIDFPALCRLVAREQGTSIGVLDLTTGLRRIEKSELISGEIGQTAMGFLDSYAARVQAILTTNDDGRLLIMRSDQAANSGEVLLGGSALGNIKESSVVYDGSKTFRDYVARSQIAVAGDGVTAGTKDVVTQSGLATDPSVRPGRFFEFLAETPMNSEGLKDRARLEGNVRSASSVKYSAVVQGDLPGLAINTKVRALAPPCGIDDNLLVSSVERVFSPSGLETIVECTVSNAYSLTAVKPQDQAARSTAEKSFR